MFRKRYVYFAVPLLFALFFSGIASLYIDRNLRAVKKQFVQHAIIIADDVWALNQDGAKSYLQLVSKAQHYKFLSISIPGDDKFLYVESPRLTGLAYYLNQINFIGVRSLQAQILHKEHPIGTLKGEQYIRVIFPLLNILIFLLLLLLVGVFISYLFLNRRVLEQQVRERTKNLEESERRFHDLVNLLPEMVAETDLDGKLVFANEKVRTRFNIDTSGLTSVSVFDLLDDATRDAARTYFTLAVKGDSADLEEFTAIDPKTGPFPILIRVAPRIVNGETDGACIIAIDTSDIHKMREQLHRDQKMKAIGLMAGGVAHDLNNILSGIVSYPELLLVKLEEGNQLRRPLQLIHKAGLAASEVVSDLLTVARGIAASSEIIAPNDLITEYLDTPDFQQLKKSYPLVSFKTILAPDLSNISCSSIHVRKCLMNLIINGVEAITGQGTLSISTENIDHTNHILIKDRNLPKGIYSKITVHDSGSGIAAHEIEHIFEPFYTTKIMGRSGTGLGLAVVWNTIRDHGGTVTVESNDRGTTFELFFPSVQTQIAPVASEENWRIYLGKGETALVVDDEIAQREIASQLLQTLGYTPHAVESGEKAVEYLQNHSADILILDMIMSPGMNGRETYSQILQTHPFQKAVIASGFAEDDDVRKTMDLGASTFVAKPYTLNQLGAAIAETLQK